MDSSFLDPDPNVDPPYIWGGQQHIVFCNNIKTFMSTMNVCHIGLIQNKGMWKPLQEPCLMSIIQNGGLDCFVFGSIFVTGSKIKDNTNLSDLSDQEGNFDSRSLY